jgi:hypothetical protein
MSRWIANLCGLTAATVAVFCCIFLWSWSRASQSTIDAENAIKASAQQLTSVEADLLRKCVPIEGKMLTVENAKDCGLLAHLGITLNTMRGTMGQFEAALKKENRAADDLHHTQASMARTIDKLGDAADEGKEAARAGAGLAAELTKTVVQVNDPDTGVRATMANVNGAVTDLRDQLKSQAVQNAAADLARGVHFTADTAQNVAGITADMKVETGRMVAPKTKTQKALGWMPTGLRLGVVVACLASGTACP